MVVVVARSYWYFPLELFEGEIGSYGSQHEFSTFLTISKYAFKSVEE